MNARCTRHFHVVFELASSFLNLSNGVLGPRIWLPNTENFFRELVDLIRNAEQSRTHCDSPDFYCRRLEEYERTLSVLTTRITESYTTEQFLINNLQSLTI